uniref:DNA-binding protein n=1 Tax=Comamonas testosteroni TaxID=285 RepID=A0A6H1Q016_COMTE|nr:DNA-binding protein [Comamonas testosteroni]QIZ20164.1 DNA-binding protein [Comamonas testosteroni]
MSAKEIRDNFAKHGISVCDWARAHGFSESLVYAVLAGRNKASRGQSFKIAVALGLKAVPPASSAPDYIQTTFLK